MKRKLPSPQEVNRLHWMEELSTQEIADRFGVTHRIIVTEYMRRHGIPIRKARKPAQCVDCGEPVCMYRHWSRHRRCYEWIPNIRCLRHAVLARRKQERERARERTGVQKLRGTYNRPIRENAWMKERPA